MILLNRNRKMNQKTLNNMLEKATDAERKQFKVTANVFLNTERKKMHKQRAEAERMLEVGISETEITLKQERKKKEGELCQM